MAQLLRPCLVPGYPEFVAGRTMDVVSSAPARATGGNNYEGLAQQSHHRQCGSSTTCHHYGPGGHCKPTRPDTGDVTDGLCCVDLSRIANSVGGDPLGWPKHHRRFCAESPSIRIDHHDANSPADRSGRSNPHVRVDKEWKEELFPPTS